MGTTIRRQPVSFPIPASPDYKFLNITDFGGLNISSNPFVVSSNTASDCLNVYVDEDNALSTRPRLQAKYDLMSLAGLDDSYELLNVYNLHNGYLLHVKKDNKGYMYRFEEKDGVLKNPVTITGDKPVEKCKIFEQNGNIYVLTGNGYKNISDDEIKDVDGYVPTTSIGKNKTTTTTQSDGTKVITYDAFGVSYESPNLLSNKYKETYFWDGISEFIPLTNAIDVHNAYYSKSDTLKDVNLIEYYDDDTFIFVENNTIKYGKMNPDYDSYTVIDFEIDVSPVNIAGVSYNKLISTTPKSSVKKFVVVTPQFNGSLIGGTFVWYKINDAVSSFEQLELTGLQNILYNLSEDTILHQSENANFMWFDKNSGVIAQDGGWSALQVGDLGSTLAMLGVLYPADKETYSTEKLHISDFENDAYMLALKKNSTTRTEFEICYADNFGINTNMTFRQIAKYNTAQAITIDSAEFLPKGQGVFLNRNNTDYTFIFKNKNFEPIDVKYPMGAISWWFSNATDAKHAIFTSSNGDVYYVPDYTEPGIYYKLYLTSNSKVINFTPQKSLLFENNELLSYQSSAEPLMTVTYTIPTNSEMYLALEDKLEILRKATLFERFDNNTWFASKNYTFHTAYNDPTYIPLSSYNDLGEDFEEITGLSIVNDNVLAAYKRNRIYIITPVTVGNEETYSYTETKNVVGNDVPDAPILTILTEMPTIVSYDGIFALNQLENVQSSDRITTLISENINPRWLKEKPEDIDNCKTLNRLYWTYYMLPHRKVDKEKKDYTKIYLLDNRTQQWYYWELPIYIINAMVKDNKTHLVHENGKIFTLETSDLIHEYNPDVTEYYDKVGKEKSIIPWYWTSQILSLSTINYSKKLVDTTFILTDTDTQDEYGLDYSFKAWRKSVSETNATTISNNIHYVQSTTKRTMIPRFNFIQIKLSNTEEDLDNNKLRLVGLGLKYVLLEGLY